MIVKKLREKQRWSQEQLAEFSGLHVRTVQRVESGHNASLETLKSLASVFEVDIATLTEEITVIDKQTENWKNLPWLFKVNMFGIRSRKPLVAIELTFLLLAFGSWFYAPEILVTPALFLASHVTGWTIRYGDRKDVW